MAAKICLQSVYSIYYTVSNTRLSLGKVRYTGSIITALKLLKLFFSV